MTDLHTPYDLTDEQISYYRANGYIKLKDVLPAEILAEFGKDITETMRAMKVALQPTDDHFDLMPEGLAKGLKAIGDSGQDMAVSDTYAAAFTQRMNLWTLSDKVKDFVFSRRLGKIAADLMGTEGVRLYHDQALYKEKGGGHTPWHCDQFYWPLSNDNTTTVWIPLQPVTMDMGPLAFAKGSHKMDDGDGRDLAISDESEEKIGELMKGFEVDNAPFDLGEVSFHAGWTFHRADPNKTDKPREAFTIIYMDRDMMIKEPDHPNQKMDLAIWTPGCQPGDAAASPINPVLYER